MTVPDSQSRRRLYVLLSLAIVSGCMADAQPEFPQMAPFAPQPGQPAQPSLSAHPSQGAPLVARNLPQQGAWIVAPPLRGSSANPYAAAPPQRLQPPPPLEPSSDWMTAKSEPVRMPQAYAAPPLRSDTPMLRSTSPVAPLSTNTAPAASLNAAPARTLKPAPAKAAPQKIAPASAPPSTPAQAAQAAWNVAPSAPVKPTPAPAEQTQPVRPPSAENGRTIATEPHVPSPDSGTIIALP